MLHGPDHGLLLPLEVVHWESEQAQRRCSAAMEEVLHALKESHSTRTNLPRMLFVIRIDSTNKKKAHQGLRMAEDAL